MAARKPRGHWPKGKTRHAPVPAARLARVQRFFHRHLTRGRVANDCSMQAVAKALGVSDRTLRRWVRGEDHPEPERWRDLIAHLESLGW